MNSLLTGTERRLPRLLRKLSNRQDFHLQAEMFSFHSKYFVYRKLKRAPQELSFCFKCSDTGTVRILGNILYIAYVDQKKISVIVLLDMSKAFDSIQHDLAHLLLEILPKNAF